MAWMPLSTYCKIYPWPKLERLKWIIWKLESQGTKIDFIHRFGKRLLIEDKLFQEWIGKTEQWIE